MIVAPTLLENQKPQLGAVLLFARPPSERSVFALRPKFWFPPAVLEPVLAMRSALVTDPLLKKYHPSNATLMFSRSRLGTPLVVTVGSVLKSCV